MRLFFGFSSIEITPYRNPKNRRKEPLANFSRFNTSRESAMEQRVVVSSFVLMSPKPQHFFARLKPRSTSIRSVLSLYAVLRSSGVGSFFWTPQSRTGYTDTLALAESSVVPIAVYLIDQHPFGIASGSLAVSLYCRDEHIRFIVSVKG